jgi:hypothetical protein
MSRRCYHAVRSHWSRLGEQPLTEYADSEPRAEQVDLHGNECLRQATRSDGRSAFIRVPRRPLPVRHTVRLPAPPSGSIRIGVNYVVCAMTHRFPPVL